VDLGRARDLCRDRSGDEPYGGRTIDRIADTRDDAEMERLLTRFRPGILAVTGTGGLLLILYLMLFKPTL